METPLKYVLSIFIFWLVLGGLFQLFDMNEYNNNEVDNPSSSFKIITTIYNLFTFNVEGMPQSFRVSVTSFMAFSLALSIYVLLRGQ